MSILMLILHIHITAAVTVPSTVNFVASRSYCKFRGPTVHVSKTKTRITINVMAVVPVNNTTVC